MMDFPEPLDLNFYPHKHPRVLIEMRQLIATDIDGAVALDRATIGRGNPLR